MAIEQKPVRVAIDIGGTFTDLQIFDARRNCIESFKIATTPEDPSIGLIEGLKQAGDRFGFALSDIAHVLHGTTIATNAVLQRRFPAGALVTTAGFEDVLEIGRHARHAIYSVKPRPPVPLIPRHRRFGLDERMSSQGHSEKGVNEADLDRIVQQLRDADVETVAICLLNAYINAEHEERLAERLRAELPELSISLSSAISPEIREYERASTTVLNALLMPIAQDYLGRLEQRLRDAGVSARLLIVQSNGGVCSPAMAAAQPVRLLLSGPSGGALGTLTMSRTLGEAALVGADMGGTSYDVSIIRDDRMEVVTQGAIDGLPVRIPMVEIRTIGAGGGSIARVGPGGRATVGPQSAGARPGPVSYRRGGTEPTVSDANLVLGHLDPAYFLGGAMPLDLEGAREAIRQKFADPLGLGIEEAAEGIIDIANTGLASAIRLSLFEKGLDPRDFALLSFGGAGSLHACAVARELGIRRVIFPMNASTFSACGILFSQIAHDFARSRVLEFDKRSPAVCEAVAEMASAMAALAHERLDDDRIDHPDRRIHLAFDLRYKGQAFELTVPAEGSEVDDALIEAVLRRFHELHEQRFSYCNPEDTVELVTVRLLATGELEAIENQGMLAEDSGQATKVRQIWHQGAWREVTVVQRSSLRPGRRLDGPAIIEEEYTTCLIAAGWSVICDPTGQLRATLEIPS